MKVFTKIVLFSALFFLISNNAIAMPPDPPGIPVGGPVLFKGSAIFAVLLLGMWAIFHRKD